MRITKPYALRYNGGMKLLPVDSEPAIASVAALATTIWREHYTPIIGAAQVAYMLERFQSAEALREQIGSGALHYFLIVSEGVEAGYLAFAPRGETLFLSKLYVLKTQRGKGLGAKAVGFAEAWGKERGMQRMELTVNRDNSASIAAYGRMGFVTLRAAVADIGGGFVMDDWVMEKSF